MELNNSTISMLVSLFLLALDARTGFCKSVSFAHQSELRAERAAAQFDAPIGVEYVREAIDENDNKLIRKLSNYAVDYCHLIGNVMLWKDQPADVSVVLPFSLLPSPFPGELFTKAKWLQPLVNELYFRVTMDHRFLVDAYTHLMDADPWVKRQVELLERVQNAGIKQHKTLILERNDYLTHRTEGSDKIELKQVEVNICQLGGPGFATNMSELHAKMLQKVEHLHAGKLDSMAHAVVPENRPRQGVAEAMLLAWEQHVKEFGDDRAVIVFMTDPTIIQGNHFEQVHFMQYELEGLAHERGHYVNVERVTILESPDRIHIDESDHSLYLDGTKRVALVHMVIGLLPHHWPTDREWNTRFDMERSNAILSPNIRAQLAGTKRVQQRLSEKGVLEHFLGAHYAQRVIDEIRSTHAGLWGLEGEDPATEAIISEAIEKPGNFVLKAQLGGGKGNFFDEELKEMLKAMTVQQRSAYTLMEKIRPVAVKNFMRRPFHAAATLEELNGEIGIFGTILGEGTMKESKIIFNRFEGYELRSKLSKSNQGGVSEGYGLIDSAVLFPAKEFVRAN